MYLFNPEHCIALEMHPRKIYLHHKHSCNIQKLNKKYVAKNDDLTNFVHHQLKKRKEDISVTY
jgi:hypothetical protein